MTDARASLVFLSLQSPFPSLPAPLSVHGFCTREPEPSLEEFLGEIERLRSAADTIRHTCTDDVRTGEGREWQEEGEGGLRSAADTNRHTCTQC